MNGIMKGMALTGLMANLLLSAPAFAASDEAEHGHDESPSVTELTPAQARMAGIETRVVEPGSLGRAITAPGEVGLDAYRTIRVTPRISAQVVERHVRLGDEVRRGQPLVSLSSVAMAEAQGGLMEASIELRRVKSLGRQVVSEKRFVAAHIAYQQAFARATAYGMTKAQIDALLETGDASRATGEFQLLSNQDGTVISDDFIVGELIEPGRDLMEISDESVLWVEARLTPEEADEVAIGAPVRVRSGRYWLTGRVVQKSHRLDETTRTLAVHIEVGNPEDRLHPGQFVTAVIESRDGERGIIVPSSAVLRGADGDWQVLVETAPGRYEAREVEVRRSVGDRTLVDGLPEGTTIVSKGAFFVQSEMAKSGFAVHNH